MEFEHTVSCVGNTIHLANLGCLFLVIGQYYWIEIWQSEKRMKSEIEENMQALKEKIAKVILDMAELQRTGDASRKFEVLSEYKEYLEDELAMLKRESRQ
jgi:hypothetical protein